MFKKTTYNLENLTSGDHKNLPSNSLIQVNDFDGLGQLFFFSITDSTGLSTFNTIQEWMVVYQDAWSPIGDGIDHIYSNIDSSLRLIFPDLSPFQFKIQLAANENSFEIPTNGAYNYHFRVNWGDGEFDIISSATDPALEHAYAVNGGSYEVEIFGVFESFYGNGWTDRFKITEVVQMGIVQWKNLEHAFRGCQSLHSFSLGEYDFSDVEDFSSMFRDCYALINYEHFNTSTGVNFNSTWRNCFQLPNLPLTDYSFANAENLSEAFYNCSSVADFGDNASTPINLLGVKYLNSTFFHCSSIDTLNVQFDGEQFERIFEACINLTCLNQVNTLNQTNTNLMFNNTPKLDNPNAAEQATITSGANWVNQGTRPCPGVAPGTITDFNASDNIDLEIHINFSLLSSAEGSPTIYYDLYSQNGLEIQNVTPGYVWSISGTFDLYVKAHNYAGETDSNHNSGTGVDPILYLTLAQSAGTINLRNIINANNPLNRTEVIVTNNLTQPRIYSGDLSGLDVTLINNGEIQANQFSGNGLDIISPMTLTNNGWIRGAGGNGGSGGAGGAGGNGGTGGTSGNRNVHYYVGSWSTIDKSISSGSVYQEGWTFSVSGVTLGIDSPCKYTSVTWPLDSYENGRLYSFCGGKSVQITRSLVGFTYVYRFRVAAGTGTKSHIIGGRTGRGGAAKGSGGGGGLAGYGRWFNHSLTNGQNGSGGTGGSTGGSGYRSSWIAPSVGGDPGIMYYGYRSGSGGNGGPGGSGGKGGNGGNWGQNGGTGQNGNNGQNGTRGGTSEDGNVGAWGPSASSGSGGASGGSAGKAINGSGHLTPASTTGSVSGVIS